MTDLNKFTATGRITANAELKYTQSGTACTTFSIAVNKSYKKDDTWEDETDRLKFKVEGETLSLVEGNTTYLFAK